MLQSIVILVIVLFAAVFAYAATKPDAFHVQRSATIKAPPEKIFQFINDFRRWDSWTPYNKDPAMKKTYNGSASGKGAAYAWDGNREVGRGSIEITESSPPSRIDLHLHMIKPFEGHNHVTFTLETPPRSPGPWTAPKPIWQKSWDCSWTWTRWSARILKWDLPR
jgi:uncharacterized protein YndB with AHSA1/START domain